MTVGPRPHAPFREAIAEAEKLIANPPFEVSEQDLAEGYDYLAGSIRSSLQMAFDYDLEHPVLINPTHQYARQGLDNPDAIYFNAYLDPEGSYVVTGVRGTTADLSFQVMDGTYSAEGAPGTVAAFDDRELDIAGRRQLRVALRPGARVEEGLDADRPRRSTTTGTPSSAGRSGSSGSTPPARPRGPLTPERVAKRYGVAAKMLVGRINTWFAFPEWFTYKEPVNTLTVPKSTPGGLASQFSSIGHYSLGDDEAMIVTVPVAECAYQAIQIGSRWYVSTDYEHHQTSLSKAQSHADPDGMLRYVVSERNPGIANWLETCGHPQGVMMLRWQRLSRALDAADGPTVEVVPFDSLASDSRTSRRTRSSPDEYAARIAARQVGIARRMIS